MVDARLTPAGLDSLPRNPARLVAYVKRCVPTIRCRQIRAGTGSSCRPSFSSLGEGLLAVTDVGGRLAPAPRAATRRPHHRRPRRADISPSSRAAFSRACCQRIASPSGRMLAGSQRKASQAGLHIISVQQPANNSDGSLTAIKINPGKSTLRGLCRLLPQLVSCGATILSWVRKLQCLRMAWSPKTKRRAVKHPEGLSVVRFERRGVGGMGIPLNRLCRLLWDGPSAEVTEVTNRTIRSLTH